MYMSSKDFTLEDVASKLGIPYETVRDWSKKDSWSVLRNLSGIPEDAIDQAEAIRLVLFQQIVQSAGHSADEIVELVKAWKSLADIHRTDESYDRDELLEAASEDET